MDVIIFGVGILDLIKIIRFGLYSRHFRTTLEKSLKYACACKNIPIQLKYVLGIHFQVGDLQLGKLRQNSECSPTNHQSIFRYL